MLLPLLNLRLEFIAEVPSSSLKRLASLSSESLVRDENSCVGIASLFLLGLHSSPNWLIFWVLYLYKVSLWVYICSNWILVWCCFLTKCCLCFILGCCSWLVSLYGESGWPRSSRFISPVSVFMPFTIWNRFRFWILSGALSRLRSLKMTFFLFC